MRVHVISVFAALSAFAPQAALSQDSLSAEQFEATLGYKSGKIALSDGLATLNVPKTFRFIGEASAKRLLEDGWGNPPGAATGVLGMLFPADLSPLSEEGWGVVISFDEDGYVDDEGAAAIDYTKLLKQMQDATEEVNKDRKKQGFSVIHLAGWAEPPTYNPTTHKMYWAKELYSDESDHHTLNYNVRVLGRRGVLVLNAVATMDQLASIKTEMQSVLGFVDFNEGHKYADFVSGTDKKAAYGIAGLVAGAVAMKAGFFKVLIAGLIAAKKLVIAGLIGLGAAWKKFFGKPAGAEPPASA